MQGQAFADGGKFGQVEPPVMITDVRRGAVPQKIVRQFSLLFRTSLGVCIRSVSGTHAKPKHIQTCRVAEINHRHKKTDMISYVLNCSDDWSEKNASSIASSGGIYKYMSTLLSSALHDSRGQVLIRKPSSF